MIELKDGNNKYSDGGPVWHQIYPLLTLLVFILVGALLGSICTYALGKVTGIDATEVFANFTEGLTVGERNFVRASAAISHLFSFILPSLFFLWFFYKKDGWRWSTLNRPPGFLNILFGVFLLFAALPLVQVSFWVNQQIPLPSWLATMEDQTTGMVSALMQMDSPFELVINLLIVSVLPGIGEELLFRGVIQQGIQKYTSKPHLAIWVTAIIFSAIHMQFEGFLPRLVLGAVMGYLFWWTGKLWVPILAHLFNNAFQVVGHYILQVDIAEMQGKLNDSIPWFGVVISIVLVYIISQAIIKNNPKEQWS